MKIINNYDLVNKLKNVNDPFGPAKVMRYYLKSSGGKLFYFYSAMDLALYPPLDAALMIAIMSGSVIGLGYVFHNFAGDFIADSSAKDLKKLVSQLKDLYIKTDYELLLQAELYDKQYKVQFDENKIPYVLESKYIMLPTYNHNNDIKDTSLVQEHVVNSREYVLSIGSPSKERKLSLVKSY